MAKKRPVRLKRIPIKKRRDVRREEFDHLIELINQRGDIINGIRHDLDIQFKRMAQIQGEIDEIRLVLQRLADRPKS
jgi:hypothetical protein